MKTYPKLLVRDFKKLYVKLLAIVFIVAIGVAFLVGLLTTAPNMRYTIDQYYKTTNTADIIIQKSSPFTTDEIETIKLDQTFDQVMPYFMIDEQVLYEDMYHMSRIVLLDFQNGINVNQLKLVEGRLPNNSSDYIEVVVEAHQAYLLKIPIGFETVVQNQTFKVVGIVNHPWYYAYVQEISPASSRPIESMIYVDQSFLEPQMFTHIAVTLKDTGNLNSFSSAYETKITNHIEDLSIDYPDFFFTSRFQNQSFVKFNSDVKIVEVIALIFPLFFFLITILVSMSSMTRIIHDERIQIGTLRAIGYRNYQIILKYIVYVLLASGVGVLLGIAIGIYTIPSIAYNAYVVTYNLPPLRIDYHLTYITSISLSMIISVVIVTFFSIKNVLKEAPSNLLKHKAPKAGKKILVERIPLIWNRLKFKYKSTIRNIFRQKRNLFLMLIGVAGSTALLLAGFGIKDAVDISGDIQFNQMYQFDIELGIVPDQVDIDAIKNYEQLPFMLHLAHYEQAAYIHVIIPQQTDALNNYLDFKAINGTPLTFKANSVFVTKQFAQNHHIEVGDTISLELIDEIKTFEVTGLIEYYFGNAIYIAPNLIDLELIIYNKIYVQTGILETHALQQLVDDLNLDPNILHVQTKDDLTAAFKQTSSSMNSVIILLVIFASILALIINYNLTLINISTRYKEMATLKVLGYHEIEVSGYIFRETFIISTIAIIIGLLLGRLLLYFIVSQVKVDGIIFKNTISYLSYTYTVLLSYVFLILVYLSSMPKIRKIDMLEALKSFE